MSPPMMLMWEATMSHTKPAAATKTAMRHPVHHSPHRIPFIASRVTIDRAAAEAVTMATVAATAATAAIHGAGPTQDEATIF